MKRGLSLVAAVFLVLTLVLPATALAQAPSAPQVSLVQPALPTAQFGSGAANVIAVDATSPGSSIVSVEYQTFFNDPADTFIAREIFAQRAISPVPVPKAGAGARVDNTAVPAGLPPTSVVSMVVLGTVTAVNAATGEWQIGTPPVFVYESQATSLLGTPAVGAAVRVEATRTLAPGPIVAEVIIQRPGGALPAAPPTVDMSFLFNGTIGSVRPVVKSAGIKLGGTTWTIGGVPFRTDDANFPGVIDSGIGLGAGLNPAVTVQFTTPLPAGATSNVAYEIFAQVPNVIPPTLHPNPVFNTEPSPLNLPAGSWKQFTIAGVVSAVSPNGEWRIGNSEPLVLVYEHAATTFSGARRPVAGDEVLVVANRTLAPGPLVADAIAFRAAGPLPPAPATATSAFLFNGTVQGTVQANGATTWSIGGVNFVVNEANLPAVIAPGVAAGSAVTVEFNFVGPPPPDAALWAPLPLNATTNLRSALLTPPEVNADRTGYLFLRATNAQQQVTTALVSASLLARPTTPPTAPANLVGTVVNPTQVKLTWTDASANETGFRVERAADAGFTLGKQTFVVAANSTSFNDTTVTSVAALFYRVFAVNGAGESTGSNVAQVPLTAPQSPANLAAVLVSPTRIDLTWVDNSSNEDGFRIERSVDGVVFALVTTVSANTTSFSDVNLVAGATHYYRVTAFNSLGNSVSAGPVSVSPAPQSEAPIIPPPAVPGATTAVVRSTQDAVIPLAGQATIRVPAAALGTTVQAQVRALSPQDLSTSPSGMVRKALEINLFRTDGTRLGPTVLSRAMTIEFSLTDSDISVIGNNPANVEVHTFDTSAGRWAKIVTGVTVDLNQKMVRAEVDHLSLFALVVPSPVTQQPAATPTPTAVAQPTPTPLAPATGDNFPGQSGLLIAILAGAGALLLGLYLLRGARGRAEGG